MLLARCFGRHTNPVPAPNSDRPFDALRFSPRGSRIRAILCALHRCGAGWTDSDTLKQEQQAVHALLAGCSETQEHYRYGPDKWSVREVIGHCADTERIFAYRALRVARGDTTPLPGFDQDAYITTAGFDARPLDDLLSEWDAVRAGSLALVRSLDAAALDRRGVASNASVSARALAWMIAGHARHHRVILAERYFGGGSAG